MIGKIEEELADVLIYAFERATSLSIKSESIIKKLERVREKYPAASMRENAKDRAGSGAGPKHWKIKNSAPRLQKVITRPRVIRPAKPRRPCVSAELSRKLPFPYGKN
ncbi:MAG: hypothetical protein KatS3mg083_027 [Candidatus Dojkabacteria bacterium]|nr:MAG: hypothetical protein KatS3mg083_027 [Candidatus Dojkabacteria bacterium]